ncbi:conserved hypothetical protein [Ricinus communis]|uniref:CST complex subunit CTC1 n=1 Tax=Ricinus communis TaxID=3988 RepID=B9R7I3_RICCO|nr:conserved hypothetical protein [Ricinus communis]
MEETVNQLTISELIRRGQPLTATATLNSSPSFPIPSSFSKSKTPPPPPDTTINSNPRLSKILSPLTHPAVLVGSLTLPTETLKCTNKNCFQFSDGSSTICCDILDFSVPVIGKRIHVLSWNFIPLKHSPGGFLEIIKCSFPDSTNNIALSRCSSVDSIPIISVPSPSSKEDRLKARYRLHGPIESISPVSIVPCSVGANKSKNLRGFIAQIRVCECKLCISKEPIKPEQQTHVFTKPSFVYFFGSSMSWHPVITKLVRKVVTLSGLKKKLVFIGKEESQLMFVITENSVIHLPRVAKNWSPFLRNVVLGKGECGDYKGAVSVVYMQGMVVELDKEVWLLLTDQLLAVPHSLRVGAIHGILTESCQHDAFGCGREQYCANLKLVPPISTFLHHCESMWMKVLVQLERNCRIWPGNSSSSLLSCKGRSHGRTLRRIFQSEDIGVSLLGSLKISPSSGRLQLVDAMGSIDVIVPDLPSGWKSNGIYEFQGELLISDNSTMFAEAIILPWDLFLPGKDGTRLPVKVSGDRPDEPLVNCSIENYQEHPPNKKCKIDQASSQTLASDMMNDCNNGCCELRTCSSLSKGSTDGKCGNLNSLLEIPCSITVRHGNIYSSFGSGKLCCTKCKTDTGACFKPSTEKVLLEFNTENFIKYQIGSYYIINHHPEESLCSIRNHNYISGVKIFISSKIHLWSLFFSSDEVIRNNRSSSDASQGDSSSSSRESLRRFQVEPLLRVTDKSPESCSDVFLYLAVNAMWFFDIKLNARKGADTDPPTAPEETSNYSISSSSLSYGSLDYTVFPEGNLTSVHGDVVAIHGFDDNSADISLSCNRLGDVLDMRFSQGKTSGSCIHVLVDNQVVTIFGSLSKYALPVGFGPDVNATFHRILKFRGTNKLMLTPVSFIVLNSIRVTNELFTEKCSDIQSSNISSASSLDNVSSGIISELIQHADGKPLQFNCRVAAVHVVVLEKNRKYYDLPSEVEYRPDFVDIPLVGLVLDDGSSTCCCWANAERAATLLRLHEELPERAFESSGCTFKWVGIEKSCWKNTVYHLERILSKHDSITVRNYGSVVESSHQDLRVSVHSDNALSSSDENLLKFILFNACFGTLWTVVANVMDPNAVKQLEKEHLMQMEMTVLPIQNIWAKEVRYVNNLTEARNMMRELLDR